MKDAEKREKERKIELE